MRINKALLPLLGIASTANLALGDFTQADVLWTANQTFAMPLVDENGTFLMGGDLVQVGYFPAVTDQDKDPATYSAAEWNSFFPLTGDGSSNPEIFNTTVSFQIPGFMTFRADFDTDVHDDVPNRDVRIGLRIYNASTVTAATRMNIVSSSSPAWIMKKPDTGINTPLPADADLDAGQAQGTLAWLGTPFQTDVIPGPPPANLVITSVKLLNPTTLEITWTGGDGTNDIQVSTTDDTGFANAAGGAGQASPATIDPTLVGPKFLIRVVEP